MPGVESSRNDVESLCNTRTPNVKPAAEQFEASEDSMIVFSVQAAEVRVSLHICIAAVFFQKGQDANRTALCLRETHMYLRMGNSTFPQVTPTHTPGNATKT